MSLKDLAKKIKKEEKERNKPLEEKFLDAIDKYFIDVANDEDEGHSLSIKPSSYYKCMRKLWYQLLGFPKKERKYARSQRILQVGTALHEWIQNDILMTMDNIELIPIEELPNYGLEGVEFITEHDASPMEVKFKDYRHTKKYPVSAMTDGAIEFLNERFVFEFKTINSKDFDNLYEPLKDHIKQGAIYCIGTGLNKVMFLYMNKDNQQLKSFLVYYNDKQLNWAKSRIVSIEQYVLNLELPPKEPDDNCKWCEYKYLCDKDCAGKTFEEDEVGFMKIKELE